MLSAAWEDIRKQSRSNPSQESCPKGGAFCGIDSHQFNPAGHPLGSVSKAGFLHHRQKS